MGQIAIYARVSDADSVRESSVPDQIKDATAFCHKTWPKEPVAVFSEVGSAATISKRPQMKRLIAAVAEGNITALVVRDPDRLSRDTQEMLWFQGYLHELGVPVWIYRTGQQLKIDTPEEELFSTFQSGIATYERKKAAVRTRDRMRHMRESGQWCGGYVPKGYKLDDQRRLVLSDDAEKIREMFRVAAKTRSLAEAWRTVTDLFKNKTGAQNALRNRIYCGDWKTGPDSWVQDHHEALIDRETWEAAQKTVGLSHNIHIRTNDRVYQLQGLVYCSTCGKKMTTYHTKKGTLRFHYYECGRGKSKCPTKRCPAADLEDMIWEKLREVCQDPKLLLSVVQAQQARDGSRNLEAEDKLAKTQAALRTVRKRLDTWMAQANAYAGQGKAPPRVTMEQIEKDDAEAQRLEAEISALKVEAEPKHKIDTDRFMRALRLALSDDASSPVAKQRVLKALLVRVVVEPRDTKLVVRDLSGALAPAAGQLRQRPEWLPELDSNQQPCD